MSSDPVANVRFNVAKTLTLVGPKLNSAAMQAHVKPTLAKLNEDADFDVRYYASEASVGESWKDETIFRWLFSTFVFLFCFSVCLLRRLTTS